MKLSEAIERMTEVAEAAMERLARFGLNMKVEVDYMNAFFKTVEKPEKAKYATVSLVMTTEGVKEGDEYCISLGVDIKRGNVDDAQLAEDSKKYEEMAMECERVLDSHETVLEGLTVLTERATAECEKLMAEIEEEQKKSRKIAMIGNIVFILGIAILFLVAIFSK